MNNQQLEDVLKQARVPEQEPGYWQRFPGRVIASFHKEEQTTERSAVHPPPSRWNTLVMTLQQNRARLVYGLSFAAACVILGFWLGFRQGTSLSAGQAASLERYLLEMTNLFPNQIKAIVFEAEEPRLVLAERADVAAVQPVWLRVCGKAKPCKTILTFSGQQVQIDGGKYEVLLGAQGQVLLVGQSSIWSSADGTMTSIGGYHIEAKPLTML